MSFKGAFFFLPFSSCCKVGFLFILSFVIGMFFGDFSLALWQRLLRKSGSGDKCGWKGVEESSAVVRTRCSR